MQAKKILSLILALALMVSVIAPCSGVYAAEETIYGENLEQVTAPEIGKEYYLGADVNGTMQYFASGSVGTTVPSSLPVVTDLSNATVMTAEDPAVAEAEDGFQLTYPKATDPSTTIRIYCYDASGSDGLLDTGNNAKAAKDTHNFYIQQIGDHSLITSRQLTAEGESYVLVVKHMQKKDSEDTLLRMVFVPLSELAEEGVYPVMFLQEHAHKFTGNKYESDAAGHKQLCWCGVTAAQTGEHTYAAPVTDGIAVSRSCTVCGYKQTVYNGSLETIDKAEIGQTYTLAAYENGTLHYYYTGGSVSHTDPASLNTDPDIGNTTKLTLQETTTAGAVEFRMTYINSSNTEVNIYGNSSGAYGASSKDSYKTAALAGFRLKEVNGEQMVYMTEHDEILVALEIPHKTSGALLWRMKGAETLGADMYPAMLLKDHVHDYTSGKPQGDENGHTEACWCGAKGTETDDHTYGAATITGDVATRTCTVCDYAYNVYDHKVQVYEPVAGEKSYYLAANVKGKLNFFISGKKTTDVKPYALHVTEDAADAQKVTLEDYTETGTTNAGKGFQMTFPNPDTTSTSTTLRIYCYDVLKDSDTVTGQTGVMDTGHNGSNTANGHTFFIDEVNGVKVLRKYSTTAAYQVILVVKYNETTGTYRMLGVPESELANEGVYPVMLLEEHAHEAGKEVASIDDNGHSYSCWCGGIAETEGHTYGKPTHDLKTKTTTRACTVCGYVNAVHGHSQSQVKYPVVGETYNLVVNVNGEIRSFITGSYTQTNPYSIITGTTVNVVELQAALEEGKGEFQIVYNNGTDDYPIYSISDGVGLSKSASYVSDPTKVSFSMDEVNGQRVLRAYGTGKILAAKYSEAKSQWRIFPVEDSEIGTEGVYPVMLTTEHTQHVYDDNTWYFDEEAGTQSHLCSICGGAPIDTMYGTDLKGTQVTEPTIGESYHLAANMGGKLYFFRHGTVTDTVPYSLVVTDDVNHSWAFKLTVEDPSALNENLSTPGTHTTGFQLYYTHPTLAGNPTARIYCIDSLKDADLDGQTGVMDTGANTTVPYKNRHNFFINEADGTIRSFYKQDHLLVVKQVPGLEKDAETGKYVVTDTLAWRMLFVPETELANEGVYPVMLMNLHEHVFNEEKQYSNDEGHYTLCDCDAKNLIPHSFGQWTLNRDAQTQTATCVVCDHTVTVASPYFDTVDTQEELNNGLAEMVKDEETNTYTVSGGNDYYLTAEKDGVKFYFRNAGKTAAGNSEGTSSTVTETTGHSLYMTEDNNHNSIIKAKVIPGNTADTYVIYAGKDVNRVVYIRDEGVDGKMDTGLTAFLGASTNATYKARSEFYWDAETGRLYQLEGDVEYVLVMKQMTATYGKEVLTEWRMVGVPAAEANAEGNYPVKLERHVHNLSLTFNSDNGTYYRECGCGYKATITGTMIPGDGVAVNFSLKLEEGETVTVTVGGKEAAVELTDKGFGMYNACVQLAAAQMTDEIKLSVGGDALNAVFTVKASAEAVKADPNSNSAVIGLMNHMLSYGAAAQNYFGYNTENLAGSEMAVTMPEENPGVEATNTLSNISYYGASMLHQSKTAIRFYFVAETVEGLTFTVDGNVVEAGQKDGKYYIDAVGVNPLNLDQDINVLVTDGENYLTVRYSPLAYIIRTYNRADASDQLKALVKAMYGYHSAAKTYIANKYLKNGFDLINQSKTTLYEGVEQYASKYMNVEGNRVKSYAITVKADANVELKVSAGAWSENSTKENPAETKSVFNHFLAMDRNEEVIAMINGGFFDFTTNATMKPYGMQIVDGVVKQAPKAGTNSDNWFGMTKDGKYVISNTEGYNATYINNVQQGIGGGKMLMIDGAVQNITSGRDYRTAVGVNAKGDLVLVAVEDATYSDICQIFVDLGMDITTVLNLDGGGSTAMYVPGSFIPKALLLGSYRNVPDAVGIVVK